MNSEETFDKNKKLVFYVINKNYPKLRNDEDISQSGYLGLWKACKKFDVNRGIKFSSFAIKCIKNEIGMFLKAQNKHIGVESLEELQIEPFKEDEHNELEFPFQIFSGKKREYLELLFKGEKNIHIKLGVSRETLRQWRNQIAERLKGEGYENVG